jgi:hypothetical protein
MKKVRVRLTCTKNLKIPIIELITCDCAYAGFRHTLIYIVSDAEFHNIQILDYTLISM